MEQYVNGFTRVLRTIDSADHIAKLISDLESQTLPGISPRDERSLLDFPEDDELDANIQKCTSLSRADLIQRATHAPEELTAAEIDLLQERYWLDISPSEEETRNKLNYAFCKVSDEHYEGIFNRLKAVRAPFYAQDEAEAIYNAQAEHGRRAMAEYRARIEREAEAQLAKAEARRPWLRRFYEDAEAAGGWGYVQYKDPAAFDSEAQKEQHDSYLGGRALHARMALGFPNRLDVLHSPGFPAWPSGTPDLLLGDDGFPREEGPEMDANLEARFQKLREDFVARRDVIPGNDDGTEVEWRNDGFRKGVLTNVFLVHDRGTVHTVLGMRGLSDEMWVWAVDPDYKPCPDHHPQYRGYFRVRLQQLVKNFYLARRFRSDEFSMADLWDMARRSRQQMFNSLNEAEFQHFSVDRFLGSLMKGDDANLIP
ncbi:hypothetical protein PG993_013117 [Apiospora rasikravindrae]|uniref:Uncharacterized protein n=1 Tax=Apiospora rasikravindrae TaxID=990691 RepID=A0ABR1RWQ5_9PEZI